MITTPAMLTISSGAIKDRLTSGLVAWNKNILISLNSSTGVPPVNHAQDARATLPISFDSGGQQFIQTRAHVVFVGIQRRAHAELNRRIHLPIFAQHHNHRQAYAWSELEKNHFRRIAQYRKAELALLSVTSQRRVCDFLRPFDADPEKFHRLLAILAQYFFQRAQFGAARRAPGGPERNQDDAAAHFRQVIDLAVKSLQLQQRIAGKLLCLRARYAK